MLQGRFDERGGANPRTAHRHRHLRISAASGTSFQVNGSHLYATVGTYTTQRTVRDASGAAVPLSPAIEGRIRRLFPFTLTADQDRAIADVCRDLAGRRPMQHLVQADVGAGKTAVANKHQCALMAPTEILAAQHAHTLDRTLEHSGALLLLTGRLPRGRFRPGRGGRAVARGRRVVRHSPAQHRRPAFRRPGADRALLELARKDTFATVSADATLGRPEHALLRRAVLDRYGGTLELAAIG